MVLIKKALFENAGLKFWPKFKIIAVELFLTLIASKRRIFWLHKFFTVFTEFLPVIARNNYRLPVNEFPVKILSLVTRHRSYKTMPPDKIQHLAHQEIPTLFVSAAANTAESSSLFSWLTPLVHLAPSFRARSAPSRAICSSVHCTGGGDHRLCIGYDCNVSTE